MYIEELLSEAKNAFCEEFKEKNCNANSLVSIPFEDKLTYILNEVETTAKKKKVVQKKFSETEKGGSSSPPVTAPPPKSEPKPKKGSKDKDKANEEKVKGETAEEAVERKKREFGKFLQCYCGTHYWQLSAWLVEARKHQSQKKMPHRMYYSSILQTLKDKCSEKPRGPKKGREWDDVISKGDAEKLDRSKNAPSATAVDTLPEAIEKINLSDSEPDTEGTIRLGSIWL